MFRTIFEDGQRVPVRIWGRSIADGTIRQLQELASRSYVVGFVAGMADAHVSDGIAVGSVFATENIAVPSALGGDLGCGMSAVPLDVEADRIEGDALVEGLARAIPVGAATHRGRGVEVPDRLLEQPLSTGSLEHAREALARKHLGTLGGGNHFVEIDRDVDGRAWLLVHSGSRGLGAAIAAHHVRAALDGALDTNTPAGASYLEDLAWALAFARANRERLIARALEAMDVGCVDEPIDIHHNFIARERWLDRDLLVHRKGAVAVPRGRRALIPGSMGTASYVVEGLGCPDAFGSCSHGAGRVMSRKEARAAIRPKALAQAMRRIAYPEHLARQLVEEAPDAYRDIREVLDDQTELVDRRVRLVPVAVLKG